ncbi:MAG: hypothetical protein JW850_05010 [Thermoflexales bacterium]|nr:hypothetical protein [Thermoflexales bacterium]
MELSWLQAAQSSLHEQGNQARCYVCGSPELAVVCHHCGRPMCKRHGPVEPWAYRLPLVGRLVEKGEFSSPTSGVWPLSQARPAHCKLHAHSKPAYKHLMIVPGIVILALGLWLLAITLIGLGTCMARPPAPLEARPGDTAAQLSPVEALRDPDVYQGLAAERCYQPALVRRLWQVLRAWLIVLLGALTTTIGVFLDRRQAAAELAGAGAATFSPGVILSGDRITADSAHGYPPVPLGPVADRIEIRETLLAQLKLDEEGHSTVLLRAPLQGEIDPGLRFTTLDRQRLETYRASYGLGEQDFVAFRAGYLVLAGRPLLHFAVRPSRRTMFWLSGQANEHPYLAGDERAPASWPITWRYTVPLEGENGDGWDHVPLRLVPVPVEMGNARRLQIELQFNPAHFPLLEPGQVLVLEEMLIEVDKASLGRPQLMGVTAGAATGVSTEDESTFQLEWCGLQFPVTEGIMRLHLPEIQFGQPVQSDAHLKGRLRLRVPALRSGLSGVRYFSALGYPVEDKAAPHRPLPSRGNTYLEVDFDLALAQLPQAELLSLNWTTNAQGAPAVTQLRRLLDRLNTEPANGGPAQDTYLRQVFESPPPAWRQGDSSKRWHWDVWGRRYHQALPVDFHMVVYGEEDADKKSRVEVSVQGQVFDQASQQAVDNTLTELRQRIIEAMV